MIDRDDDDDDDDVGDNIDVDDLVVHVNLVRIELSIDETAGAKAMDGDELARVDSWHGCLEPLQQRVGAASIASTSPSSHTTCLSPSSP